MRDQQVPVPSGLVLVHHVNQYMIWTNLRSVRRTYMGHMLEYWSTHT